MKEIKITDIEGFYIGQCENAEAGTGCTVVICPDNMKAAIDVRGGGPASRDSQLLSPLAVNKTITAVLLGGGSAFGLDAAGGVMQYLEEKGIGYDVGITKIPLVAQSDLFDLMVGDSRVRPDKKMGYETAKAALETQNYRDGNYGAGCGATVGKIGGMEYCMKSGIGSYAVQIGDLKVGAIVAVNAIGDIYDWTTGKKIAGFLNEEKNGFRNTEDFLVEKINAPQNRYTGNTTLGIVITNADVEKAALCKIAGMAHDGYARAIKPVHTTVDGDTIYCVSKGNVQANIDVIGTVAADVMSQAIMHAVKSAEPAYGLKAYRDIDF